MLEVSVLDLVRIPQGGNARTALDHARGVAVAAEEYGYKRYWVSEHHGIRGNASAATPVILTHIAANTSTIRVGAGGVMLPNHSPLIVAEMFGTIEHLYPGRVDLGLGRADGSVDPRTAQALHRRSAHGFADDVVELCGYLGDYDASNSVNASPAQNTNVPTWILGTSLYSAELAASLGMPYAVGSHLTGYDIEYGVELYRTRFRPSSRMREPYVAISANVFVAPTDEEAHFLMSTRDMILTELIRGDLGPSRPPIANMDAFWSPIERFNVQSMKAICLWGAPNTIRTRLQHIIDLTGAQELLAVSDIYDQQARHRSYRLLKQAADGVILHRAGRLRA
jgi:luciferase family oxidoreductase group 1